MQFCAGYILGGLTVTGLAVSFGAGALVAINSLARANVVKNEKAQEVIDQDAAEYLTTLYKDFFNKK